MVLMVEITTISSGVLVRKGESEFSEGSPHAEAVALLLTTNDEVILIDAKIDMRLRYWLEEV